MFRTTLLLAFAAFTSFVSAQNYSTSGPLTINPAQISPALRESWCRGQQNNCPLICGGHASSNQCNPTTLTYTCTCQDGSKPNISSYSQTMPFYICEQWRTNCVKSHPNMLTAQTNCQSVVCGQKNASELATSNSGSASSSSSSAMSMTSTSSATSSSSGGSSSGGSGGSSSSSGSSGAAALSLGMSYGTGLLAVGMLILFGAAL